MMTQEGEKKRSDVMKLNVKNIENEKITDKKCRKNFDIN